MLYGMFTMNGRSRRNGNSFALLQESIRSNQSGASQGNMSDYANYHMGELIQENELTVVNPMDTSMDPNQLALIRAKDEFFCEICRRRRPGRKFYTPIDKEIRDMWLTYLDLGYERTEVIRNRTMVRQVVMCCLHFPPGTATQDDYGTVPPLDMRLEENRTLFLQAENGEILVQTQPGQLTNLNDRRIPAEHNILTIRTNTRGRPRRISHQPKQRYQRKQQWTGAVPAEPVSRLLPEKHIEAQYVVNLVRMAQSTPGFGLVPEALDVHQKFAKDTYEMSIICKFPKTDRSDANIIVLRKGGVRGEKSFVCCACSSVRRGPRFPLPFVGPLRNKWINNLALTSKAWVEQMVTRSDGYLCGIHFDPEVVLSMDYNALHLDPLDMRLPINRLLFCDLFFGKLMVRNWAGNLLRANEFFLTNAEAVAEDLKNQLFGTYYEKALPSSAPLIATTNIETVESDGIVYGQPSTSEMHDSHGEIVIADGDQEVEEEVILSEDVYQHIDGRDTECVVLDGDYESFVTHHIDADGNVYEQGVVGHEDSDGVVVDMHPSGDPGEEEEMRHEEAQMDMHRNNRREPAQRYRGEQVELFLHNEEKLVKNEKENQVQVQVQVEKLDSHHRSASMDASKSHVAPQLDARISEEGPPIEEVIEEIEESDVVEEELVDEQGDEDEAKGRMSADKRGDELLNIEDSDDDDGLHKDVPWDSAEGSQTPIPGSSSHSQRYDYDDRNEPYLQKKYAVRYHRCQLCGQKRVNVDLQSVSAKEEKRNKMWKFIDFEVDPQVRYEINRKAAAGQSIPVCYTHFPPDLQNERMRHIELAVFPNGRDNLSCEICGATGKANLFCQPSKDNAHLQKILQDNFVLREKQEHIRTKVANNELCLICADHYEVPPRPNRLLHIEGPDLEAIKLRKRKRLDYNKQLTTCAMCMKLVPRPYLRRMPTYFPAMQLVFEYSSAPPDVRLRLVQFVRSGQQLVVCKTHFPEEMRELRGRYCYKTKLGELYEKYLGRKATDFPDMELELANMNEKELLAATSAVEDKPPMIDDNSKSRPEPSDTDHLDDELLDDEGEETEEHFVTLREGEVLVEDEHGNLVVQRFQDLDEAQRRSVREMHAAEFHTLVKSAGEDERREGTEEPEVKRLRT